MNPETKKEALALYTKLKKTIEKSKKNKAKLDFVLAPPAIYLDAIARKNKKTLLQLSGQDTFYKSSGSVTGGISQAMLKDLGADFSIVGHWERRNIFGETSADVAKKVHSLLGLKMKAIVCVGEKERDEKGDFADILEKQILESLKGVEAFDLKNIYLAYEPVWAIGAGGKKVTLEILEQSMVLIKKILQKKYGDSASKIKIIYGGSVDDTNILELANVFGVDGFLLGRSGLKPDVFKKMIESFSKK